VIVGDGKIIDYEIVVGGAADANRPRADRDLFDQFFIEHQ
jgi:hypothetical protein